MTIGEKIRMYREMRNLNQIQLAELSDINVSTIRKYELGDRNPKPDQLIKIANGLGINTSVFYDLDISTGGDVMALLFMIADVVDVQFEGQDENGKFNKEQVSLKFTHPIVQTMIAEWAEFKKNIDKMVEVAENQTDSYVQENTYRYINSLYDEFKLREMDNKLLISKDNKISIKISNNKNNN